VKSSVFDWEDDKTADFEDFVEIILIDRLSRGQTLNAHYNPNLLSGPLRQNLTKKPVRGNRFQPLNDVNKNPESVASKLSLKNV
jgi:hypothetical protein